MFIWGKASHDSSPLFAPEEEPIGGPPTRDVEHSAAGDDRRSNTGCFHGLSNLNQPRGRKPGALKALVNSVYVM